MSQEFLPTGLRAYLQYCKCCIYCFVIQLLSEPDKLNWCSLFQVGFRHATLLAFSGFIPSLIVLAQYLKQYSQYSKLSLSNYSIMRCICKMRDALVKEKTLLDWLAFSWFQYFGKLFLVYYREGRDWTKLSDSKEGYKTFLFETLLIFICKRYLLKSNNECLFWKFLARLL